MQLSELLLNRHLYRDSEQDSSTKDSIFQSVNTNPEEPVPLLSGEAAQDINTSNVFMNGGQLEPGTVPQTVLDVSNWGWGQTSAFSSTDSDTVSWGSGTFTSAGGTSYAISAGNTGNMSAKTYIYLDLLTSETVYQVTTTSADSVGTGKVLIAVAQNGASSATYDLSQATQIVGDNILANSINASKIVAGSITTDRLLATAIDGMTITGAVIKTSATGERIELDSDSINSYDSGNNLRMRLVGDSLSFLNSAEVAVGSIIASTDAVTLSALKTDSNVILLANGDGYAALGVDSTAFFYADGQNNVNVTTKHIAPSADSTYDIGTSARKFDTIYVENIVGASVPVDLSDVTIDGDKDWGGYDITSLGRLSMSGDIDLNNNDISAVDSMSFNGSGSFIDNLSALYLDGRSSTPGSPDGAIWFHDSGGTVQIRTSLAGTVYRFNLTAV
jgi:hypothetical protein